MKPLKRIVVTALLLGAAVQASAQLPAGFPSRPVRFLVGFPPGGTNDIIARLLAQKLTEQSGVSYVVENRPGANTAIASEVFVRSAPDGYTIMQVAPGHATNPAMLKLNFDPI
ncbi:MAG: Bug family tripartite tricarboxylate transporter substrate binding protein, partial [Burkholderiales bacterium]